MTGAVAALEGGGQHTEAPAASLIGHEAAFEALAQFLQELAVPRGARAAGHPMPDRQDRADRGT
ncbi:hypothetical protein BJM39_18670 [Salmonella enterica subsp. enterica serovar Javiana]|nr:hypothetical protein BJM39_18670 [Salmonella enterica subsp. enterica serovar Javiana]